MVLLHLDTCTSTVPSEASVFLEICIGISVLDIAHGVYPIQAISNCCLQCSNHGFLVNKGSLTNESPCDPEGTMSRVQRAAIMHCFMHTWKVKLRASRENVLIFKKEDDKCDHRSECCVDGVYGCYGIFPRRIISFLPQPSLRGYQDGDEPPSRKRHLFSIHPSCSLHRRRPFLRPTTLPTFM